MASELVEQLPGMVETIGDLSTWVADKGGGLVLKGLFQGYADELGEKLRKLIEEGKVTEEFERSRHGRSLLQEAMNALWTARDQERAEAIQRVFLGLAMNHEDESLEQIEQLQILRITAELTTWEVMACNILERYRVLRFDERMAKSWANGGPDEKGKIQGNAGLSPPRFEGWLRGEYYERSKAAYVYITEAITSLHQKRLLEFQWSDAGNYTSICVYKREGAFTDFGWKLAQHLYSAEVPTQV
jgi:hypothetical protein